MHLFIFLYPGHPFVCFCNTTFIFWMKRMVCFKFFFFLNLYKVLKMVTLHNKHRSQEDIPSKEYSENNKKRDFFCLWQFHSSMIRVFPREPPAADSEISLSDEDQSSAQFLMWFDLNIRIFSLNNLSRNWSTKGDNTGDNMLLDLFWSSCTCHAENALYFSSNVWLYTWFMHLLVISVTEIVKPSN